MTREEKIEFLQQYLDMEPEIVRLQNEMDRWRSIAERCTPVMGVSGAGGGSDKLQSAIAEIDELQRRLAEKIESAVQARKDVDMAIKNICVCRNQNLMRLRYLEGRTFESIAETMGMSRQWIHRLHSEILEEICVSC